MYLPPDIPLQNRLSRWSRYLMAAVIIIAILVLFGWQFNSTALKRMGTPLVAMNPTTAVCFVLASLCCLGLARPMVSRSTVIVCYLLAAFVCLLGLSRMIGIANGIDLGLDTLLFRDRLLAEAIPSRTNRVSLNTGVGFFLLGIGLLCFRYKNPRQWAPFQYVSLLVVLLSLLSLLSYLYQTESFFGVFAYIPMAVNTAACFFLFSLALLFSKPDIGLMREFTSTLSGSMTARVLIPTAVLVPAIFGLIRLWGYWEGFYNTEFGVTLYSIVIIIIFTAIAWYTTTALNKRDWHQQETQRALSNSEREIQAIFSNAPDAIVVIDQEGRVVKWNPQSEKLFGWNEAEMTGKLLSDYLIPPEFREAHNKGLQRYLQSDGKASSIVGKMVEIWGLKKNAEPVDVSLTISPLLLNEKQYFIGFLRDITEQKQIEDRLKNFNQELTSQVEEKIRETKEIFERITDGVIALDRNFCYTYANEKIGELTHRNPDSLIGKNIWEEFPAAVGSPTYHAFVQAMEEQRYITNTDHSPQLDLWQENHIYPSANGLSVFIRDISEKRKAEREISKAKTLADKLIDSLPGVFYFFDDKGKFIRWNRQFEIVTGYTGTDIANMHPSDFFEGDEKDYIIERIRGVFETGANDAEAHFVTKAGLRIPYFFKAVMIEYEGKPCLLGTGIDITERRQAEAEIKLSEQKYKLLFRSNPLPMWMHSLPEFDIIEVNEAALLQYGYTHDAFLQLDILKLAVDEDKEKIKGSTNRNFRGIHYAGVWRHQKKGGDIMYVNIVTHDIYYEGKPVRLVLATEVTEQYLAEERLKESYESIRKLTEHMNNIREEERLHMAREIHDELGQLLTVLKMDVSWLNKKIDTASPPVKAKMTELLRLIDTTVKTVRRIASELRPSLLDDLGLVAAMEWHLEEFERRSGIEQEIELPDEELQLPDPLKIGLFRILQESLTNVARHSNAKKVTVRLLRQDKQLILTIADDGEGFDETRANKKTLGLLGMKERTLVMGGNYHVCSEPGMGTTVTVSVPIER